MLIPCDEVNILNTFRVMIILRLLLLLTNLHLILLSTQGTGADKLLSTQRVNTKTFSENIIEEKEAVKEQSDAAKSVDLEATGKEENQIEDEDAAIRALTLLTQQNEEEDDATRALSFLTDGNRNLHNGDVVTAVIQLKEACDLLAAMHGKTSDQVADAYYIYGSALLEMSRIENGIGGTAMKGEEREKIEDQVMDAMTEEHEEKKSDDKAEEETLKSQTSGDANDDAKPVTNGHTNGVIGHSETNGVNGHSETNGDAKPTDISNSEEKQNSPTNGDKKTEEKATEHNNEYKKDNGKETEEKAETEEMETEDKENEKPTEMETDKPKEKGKETEGTDTESEDLEGEAEPQDGEEQGEEDAKEGESKEPEEYLSSFQLARKMLGLAKNIYSRGTTKEVKIKLSEAYMKLAEVGLEAEQYQQAIGNFKRCLNIQQANLSPDSRHIADTHNAIGLVCGFCGQYDESISSYKSAVTLMESKIEIISGLDEQTPETKKEMKHLERLLPVIKAKIEDTLKKQSCQEKVKNVVQENIAIDTDGTMVTTGFGEQPECSTKTSDEPKSASDITHLVSEKRKQDDDQEEEATKKAKVEESDSKKEESKPEERKSEEKKRENDQKDTDEKMDTST